jgi:hypothetical protein
VVVTTGKAASLGETAKERVRGHPAVGEQLVQLVLSLQGTGYGVVLASADLKYIPVGGAQSNNTLNMMSQKRELLSFCKKISKSIPHWLCIEQPGKFRWLLVCKNGGAGWLHGD